MASRSSSHLVGRLVALIIAAALCAPAGAFAAPGAPVLTLADRSLVTSGRVITGLADTSADSIALFADGQLVSTATSVAPDGTFAIAAGALPYGRFALTAVAQNSSGSTPSTPITVYNLGASPGYSKYVLVDKSDLMLYLVKSGVVVQASPVAIGMPRTPTRTGSFLLGKPERKRKTSAWGIRRMPLLRRVHGRWRATSYYIHGTNDPGSIGTWASHGCIRMYNRDALALSRTVGRVYAIIRR